MLFSVVDLGYSGGMYGSWGGAWRRTLSVSECMRGSDDSDTVLCLSTERHTFGG